MSKVPAFNPGEKFNIGHTEIDEEHDKLALSLNAIIHACNEGNIEKCEKTCRIFLTQLDGHHDYEAKVMNGLGFKDAEHELYHMQAHEDLSRMFLSCETIDQWRECLIEILDFYIRNILEYDLKFKAYLEEIGWEET